MKENSTTHNTIGKAVADFYKDLRNTLFQLLEAKIITHKTTIEELLQLADDRVKQMETS